MNVHSTTEYHDNQVCPNGVSAICEYAVKLSFEYKVWRTVHKSEDTVCVRMEQCELLEELE